MVNLQPLAERAFSLGNDGHRGPLQDIARRYFWALPVVGALGFVASLLEGLGIALLIPLLASLVPGSAHGAIPRSVAAIGSLVTRVAPGQPVMALAAAMFGLIVIKGAVQVANATLIVTVEGRAGHDIRTAISRKIVSLPYPFFLKTETSRMITIITVDSWLATEAFGWTFAIVQAAFSIAIFSLILIVMQWNMFAVVAIGLFLIRLVYSYLGQKIRLLSHKSVVANNVLAERMLSIVTATKVIRIFGGGEREVRRFVDASQEVRKTMVRSRRSAAALLPGLEILFFLLFLAVVLVAYQREISLPVISAFLVLLYRLQPHVRAVGEARLNIAGLDGAIRQVSWLLDQPEALAPTASRLIAEELRWPIRFDAVSYAYPNGSDALTGVSFVLEQGSATALIGRSGSGKSTIANLLARLIEPQSGAITAGERPASDWTSDAWQARIAVAGQDVELIDGTIAQNIAYGRPDADHAQIRAAAVAAEADLFIGLMAQGYDSAVSLGGQNLSPGQRQRIGLARALLRGADLLILDEATSAIDGISETAIVRLLEERHWFKAALIISHRRSTLTACRSAIVVDHGRIAECGPVETLAYFKTMSSD